MMIRLGILASTRGTDMQAIIDAIEAKQLDAKIAVVISNKKNSGALERAKKHGIKAVFIEHRGKEREVFDKQVSEVLEKEKVELILLIGFMRILSDWFCKKYRYKIVNIHPSLLPLFAGGMDINVHQEVLDAGMEETGCTLHYTTEELDSGPIIMQKKVKVEADDDVDSLKNKVQKAEQEVLLDAIRLFNENRIRVEKGEVIIE